MGQKKEEKIMLRVLLDQRNEDGSLKVINGKPLTGGVVVDRIGEALNYVYDESKYDYGMNRKEEFYAYNWDNE